MRVHTFSFTEDEMMLLHRALQAYKPQCDERYALGLRYKNLCTTIIRELAQAMKRLQEIEA